MTPLDHRQFRRTIIAGTVCACVLVLTLTASLILHEYACHVLSLASQADRPILVIEKAEYIHYSGQDVVVSDKK